MSKPTKVLKDSTFNNKQMFTICKTTESGEIIPPSIVKPVVHIGATKAKAIAEHMDEFLAYVEGLK